MFNNTFIKNRGMSQTVIIDNKHNKINKMNEINWDADYDGDIANISIDTVSNGKSKHFDIKLDNNDLDDILNVESVNIPVDKRLQNDFDEYTEQDEPYFIKLPRTPEPDTTPEELINRRISSPTTDDIFLPYSMDNKTPYNYKLTKLTHKKRHKHRKPYVTYKLIKKTKPRFSRKKLFKSTRRKSSNSKSTRRKTSN